MKRIICTFAFVAGLFISVSSHADNRSLKFENQVHDFGQILLSEGQVSCTFSATNVSSSPIAIQSVTTSCGCTSVQWDHKTIEPGQKTKISATYRNDEGPYPFDKTITVKLVGQKQPILLHIRGISMEKKKSDAELFTVVHGGTLGMMTDNFKCGNVEQGRSRGDEFTVANLSDKPLKLSFANVSEGLSLEVRPNPIPAQSHAHVSFTVTAIPNKWGNNMYYATTVIAGKPSGKSLSIKAFTVEDFSSLSKEERSMGSLPTFIESTFSFGHKKKGETLKATFPCTNKGKSPFVVHRAQTECSGATPDAFPTIAPGATTTYSISLDTKDLPKGEALVIVTLTTNSPLRPIVNLFLAGWID